MSGLVPKILSDKYHPSIVTVDISEEDYKRVLNEMVIAFIRKRKDCETEAKTRKVCKSILDACITGVKSDGKPWKNAPGRTSDTWYDVLKKRLRVHKYDMDTKSLIYNHQNDTSSNIREKFKLDKEKREEKKLIESSEKDDGDLSLEEKMLMEQFEEKFKNDFPASITVVDSLMIKRLAYLSVMHFREQTDGDVSKNLTDDIIRISESLGVAGKQRINQHDKDTSGTLEELISIYKKTKSEYIDIDKEWRIEELTLISNAIHRGDLQEFLGMSWVRRLMGSTIEGKDLSVENLDSWLRDQGVKVATDKEI